MACGIPATCQTAPGVFASVTPNPPAANAAATVRCSITGLTPGTEVRSVAVTVGAGALPNGTTYQEVAQSPPATAPFSVDLAWAAPGPGSVPVTCYVTTGACTYDGQHTITAVVQSVAVPVPVVEGTSGPTSPVLVGTPAQLAVVAADGGGGLPLVYAWSASGGALSANGPSASWTPSDPGSFTVSVTVRNQAGGETTVAIPVTATVAVSEGTLAGAIEKPRRIATGPGGGLEVVDARGRLWMFTARGDLLGKPALPAPARAVAASQGEVFVATEDGRLLVVDPLRGEVRERISLGSGGGPNGMAWEPSRRLLWMAEHEAGLLRAVRPDGSQALVIRTAGATELRQPRDVAVDPARGLVWVVHQDATNRAMAHAFTVDGAYVRSVLLGAAVVSGVAVAPGGQLYASDTFFGQVKVVSPDGTPLDTLGGYGAATGNLRLPEGLAFLGNGDLVVANRDLDRLERFGAGQGLPACTARGQVDTDCDGLPDAWEIAHGLDPTWAGDALLDPDRDGLTNLQEFALGTDPRRADTDGDGMPDGEEVALGRNPLDPSDGKPTLVVSSPAPTGPGLVRIGATVTSRAACRGRWRQTGGPPVELRGARGLSPSFVARRAATYTFEGVALCGGVASDPATVSATVLNVAPVPYAGRVHVASSGRWVALDGGLSSDANGDPFALAWDQTLGPPLAGSSAGPDLALRAREEGLYAFQLTARDPAGLSGSTEVPLLVLDDDAPAPTAVAVTPVVGEAGASMLLDARASLAGRDAAFAWRQVAGPAVGISGADRAAASFVPPAPGHYAFEVHVRSGEVRAPPARVDAYVARPGGALPRARIAPPQAASVGEPLTLDGRGSAAAAGGPLSWRWRQVDGPAAGLTEADAATATVVPFTPGTHVFELRVAEGDVDGIPERVRFEASATSGRNPAAAASAPAEGRVGRKVRLDGRASSGARHYRWTQVAGPWVALDDPSSATPAFRPRSPGSYLFELEVDDGSARSAPAPVSIAVLPAERDGD